jgi:hypothetical protein
MTIASEDDASSVMHVADSAPIANGVNTSMFGDSPLLSPSEYKDAEESPRKRRRIDVKVVENGLEINRLCVTNSVPVTNGHKQKSKLAVLQPGLVHPKSQYQGYQPPLPVERERYILKDFLVSRQLASSSSTF